MRKNKIRIWHQSLIPYLPRQQLLGQHREYCALREKSCGRKHSIVDYVFIHSLAYYITTICKLNEHYYAVEQDASLTEYGEDYYDEQPYEVFPEEEKQVFIVNKWKNKNGDTICEFYEKEKHE